MIEFTLFDLALIIIIIILFGSTIKYLLQFFAVAIFVILFTIFVLPLLLIFAPGKEVDKK